MLKLSFKQTNAEIMVRAAATVLFNALERNKTPQVSIAELSERPQYGFTASAVVEPVGPKLVRITDLQDGKIDWGSVPFCKCETPDKYMLRENDILFARTGATTGKTYLVCQPQPAVFASYLIRLRPKPGVNAGYLYAFFQSNNYWSQILAEKEGSAQPNVNGEKLSSLFIPIVPPELQNGIAEFLKCVRARQDGASTELPDLPPPLAEQRRIVAKIDELATKTEEARGLRQKSKADIEVIWPALLGFAYDEAKSTTARVERLGDLCCQITDGTHLTPTYVDDGVPFLSVKDITSGRISFENVKYITPEEHAILTKRCKPERDDVLLTKVGTTGYAKVIDVDREFSIFVSLALLKLDKTRLLPKFTEHMLNSSRLKEYSKEGTRGVGNQNLVLKFIREFPVPVPALQEQRRIVSYIDELQLKIEALRRAQAESAAELDALLPSILDKAFKGEL